MDTLALRSVLVHRLDNAVDLDDTAAEIASNLLTVGQLVPSEDWLIVGGSLARAASSPGTTGSLTTWHAP